MTNWVKSLSLRHMDRYGNLVLIVGMVSLAGCAMAPGMHMEEPAPDVPGVEIMSISAGLYNEYYSQTDPGIKHNDLKVYAGVTFDF